MASESKIAHSAFGLMAIDAEPIRARGIIVKYVSVAEWKWLSRVAEWTLACAFPNPPLVKEKVASSV